MYSSGSPEGGPDSSENRGEFLEKLQRAKSQIKAGTPSQPILSSSTSPKINIGNWSMQCKKEGEIQIHNSDGQQVVRCHIFFHFVVNVIKSRYDYIIR